MYKGKRVARGKHASKRNDASKKQVLKKVFNSLYYAGLVLLVLVVFFLSKIKDGGAARTYVGYGAFVVLSGSMQTELPKDSLVIVRKTDPQTLQIGDDITFLSNGETVVTHRIVEIQENYDGDGRRMFRTKGIMNAEVDASPVRQDDIIGKVIFHNYMLGKILVFLGDQWPIIVFLSAIAIVLSVVLKYIQKNEGAPANEQNPPEEQMVLITLKPVEGETRGEMRSLAIQIISNGKCPVVVRLPEDERVQSLLRVEEGQDNVTIRHDADI